MSKELNPTLRATHGGGVTSPNVRQGSDALRLATAELQATYPGFVPFTTGVTIPVNVGATDYDAVLLALEKRYSNNYSVRVSYTLGALDRQHAAATACRRAASRCSTT